MEKNIFASSTARSICEDLPMSKALGFMMPTLMCSMVRLLLVFYELRWRYSARWLVAHC